MKHARERPQPWAVSARRSFQLVLCSVALCSMPNLSKAQEGRLTWNIGNGATLDFYGYIKADVIRDDGYNLGATTAPLKDIGLPDGPAAGRSETSQLNETRFGFHLGVNENVSALFEWDFFGTKDLVRLRLGYVNIGPVIVGQDWTNFMSVETLPLTVDFEGPPSVPFARVPQVRYDWKVFQELVVSASVEEDVGNPGDVAYTLAARYGLQKGMVRIAGLARDASVGGNPIHGWGLNLSALLELWEGGRLQSNYAIGVGVTDYFAADLLGPAVFKEGRENEAQGATLSASQDISDRLTAAITTGWLDVDRASGTETNGLETLHVSAFYELDDRTTLMGEYFKGWREDGAGKRFDTDRVQVAVKWVF